MRSAPSHFARDPVAFQMMQLSPLKRAVFALITLAIIFGVTLGVLLAADLYAHTRVERSAGLNRHGYRGPVIARKQPGEVRAVMLGGSTVFGFNIEVEDALPEQLERALAAVEPNARVVNLGYHQEAAVSFVPTLRSFAFLDYDIVLLYEGYNDILGDGQPNNSQKRHASALFRTIGYYPILPQILREKAGFLRGQNGQAQVVFQPSLANRTSAAALDASSAFAEALGRQLDRIVDPVDAAPHSGPGCGAPWSHYCGSVGAAVRYALDHNALVLVIGQPRLPHDQAERHASQQHALSAMIAAEFGGNPRVRYLDLADAVDLSDTGLAFDGLHLNREANAMVVKRLVGPVRELIAARRSSPAK
jgi:hypothetical protein